MDLLKRLFTAVSGTAPSEAAQTFIAASREGLAQQTAGHSSVWRLGQEQRWDADLEAGTLVFSFDDGATATASLQVVGTYNTEDGTFLWGWDHPSVPEALSRHARLCREWGERHRAAAFTERKVVCTEDDAWGFAAVANRLAGANGVYRGPSGTAMVFMTFGEVTLQPGQG